MHRTGMTRLAGALLTAGVLVLGVFAVFEKKRQDVLRVVEQVRGWSP